MKAAFKIVRYVPQLKIGATGWFSPGMGKPYESAKVAESIAEMWARAWYGVAQWRAIESQNESESPTAVSQSTV